MTQLTVLDENFNAEERIIFGEVKTEAIPGSSFFGNRSKLRVKYPDGKIGNLIVKVPECFSFGVKECRSPDGNSLTGWSMSLSLYDNRSGNGPTPEQEMFIEKFNEICDYIEKYVVQNYKSFGFKSDKNMSLKCNPMAVDDTGKYAPSLYPKLIDKKRLEILTKFYNPDVLGEDDGLPIEINPLSLIDKKGRVTCAIIFDSFYKGSSKASTQIKVYEACYKAMEGNGGLPSLLRVKPTSVEPVKNSMVSEQTTLETEIEQAVEEPLVETKVKKSKGKKKDIQE